MYPEYKIKKSMSNDAVISKLDKQQTSIQVRIQMVLRLCSLLHSGVHLGQREREREKKNLMCTVSLSKYVYILYRYIFYIYIISFKYYLS